MKDNVFEFVHKKFKIEIGQPGVMGFPMGDPLIHFILDNHFSVVRLEDLKNWINTIWDSQGDRNPKAYKARDELQGLFKQVIFHAIEDYVACQENTE